MLFILCDLDSFFCILKKKYVKWSGVFKEIFGELILNIFKRILKWEGVMKLKGYCFNNV